MTTDREKQEERERALREAIAGGGCERTVPPFRTGAAYTQRAVEIQHLLRDCVPVEREEYERLRRALWEFILSHGFPSDFHSNPFHYSAPPEQFVEWDDDQGRYRWTPAAHEFARAMREKGGEEA